MTIQEHLNKVDYSFKGFMPSVESMMFFNFIKEVNNGREENESPLVHCLMLDKMVNDSRRVAIMASRGLSKSSLIEYLILYLACFEELGSIKKPTFMLYVADSIENGVKRLRSSLEMKYANSDFLQKMIPNKNLKFLATDAKTEKEYELSDNDINDLGNAGRSITDVKITFININGTPLCIRNYGVKTGIRGTREFGTRPTLCHKKGTLVVTNEGYHKVEDYSYRGEDRVEKGITVSLHGLIREEVVTLEHRYMIATKIAKRRKIHLAPPQHHKSQSMAGLTRSEMSYEWIEPRWVEAQDISINRLIGNQRYMKDYIVKPIDYSIRPIPFDAFVKYERSIDERDEKGRIIKSTKFIVPTMHKHISHPSWWYLYGLYLSDGCATKHTISFTFDNKKPHLIEIFRYHCNQLGYKQFLHKAENGKDCQVWAICDTMLSRYHKNNHKGNSVKFIPEWVLYQPVELQKQLLLGYIAGDGYIDYNRNQIRINSVNEDAINKLGFIAERLGLPYHIRWARKKEIVQYIGNREQPSLSRVQFEIRFSQNVREILGIDINGLQSEDVFIKNGYVYRKVQYIKYNDHTDTFIPIQTPSHTYITQFGLSHNCALDDCIRDEDARSDTILQAVENIVYQAIPYALHPTKQKIIWVGTPFNANDPLYKAIESGRWDSLVLPICEKFPCSREEFRGAWEDRFTYDAVNGFYQDAIAKGDSNGFYQELMMSIISDEQLLIKKDSIKWLSNSSLGEPSSSFNYYITTDFAFSEKTSADWSVISVWAYTNNEDFILIDGICAKQTMDLNIKDMFRLVARYKPLQVGIEVTGQQGGFIRWIQEEQLRKNIYFDIKECRPSKDKFSRFLAFAPMYHRGKVYIYEGMKTKESYYNEYMDEVLKVSKTGFKSKHDDVLDTNSMLLDLDLYAPSGSSYNPLTDEVETKQDLFYQNKQIDLQTYYFNKDENKRKDGIITTNNLIF